MSGELRGDPLHESTETENKNTKGEREEVHRDISQELSDWLQEFSEILVDESTSEALRRELMQRSEDTSSSPDEPLMESRTKVERCSGKHSVCAHFPKDPNCEICHRTKITRAPCTRRIGEVLSRAEKFGVLITADHQVFLQRGEV